MTDGTTDSPAPRPSFEQALAELERIMHDLEEGNLGLAEGLARYERGVTLLKQCYQLLEHAERRIEMLCGTDAEGNPVTQPFDAAGDASLEEKAKSRGRRRSAPRASRASERSEDESAEDADEPGSLF